MYIHAHPRKHGGGWVCCSALTSWTWPREPRACQLPVVCPTRGHRDSHRGQAGHLAGQNLARASSEPASFDFCQADSKVSFLWALPVSQLVWNKQMTLNSYSIYLPKHVLEKFRAFREE